MISEQDLATTNIFMRYDLSPSKNIIGDLSGLIGNFCDELIGAFYPKTVSRKANVVVTELFDNALENIIDRESKIVLELELTEDKLMIRVSNVATKDQYKKVKAHVESINSSENLKKLMADTIRIRRKDRLKGGLGLIRLAAENKFRLSVRYRTPFLVVESQILLGGIK